MKALLAITFALAAARLSAEAQVTPLPEKTFGPWQVYATSEDCWMKRTAPNGNQFLLSTSSDDKDLYIVMRKPGWTFIKEDAEIPMRVQFAGTDKTKAGSGSVGEGDLTPGLVMFLDDDKRDYLADLRNSKVIRTWLNGKPAMVVSMAGSKPALDYFGACTTAIRRKAN